ncbi:MAG: Fe-S cluster assembly protein SufD [Cytophagales bacterium]
MSGMKSLSIENIEQVFASEAKKLTLHSEAIEQLKKLGFPSLKHEEWKYTNVSELLNQEYEWKSQSEFSADDLKNISIHSTEDVFLAVFVNGVFQKNLSSLPNAEKVLIMPLSEATEVESAIVEKYLGKQADVKKDAFTALNTAFLSEGLYIHLGHNQVLDKPLFVYLIEDGRKENTFSQLRNLFVFGKNTEAKIVEVFVSLGNQVTLSNVVTEISLWENAHIELIKLQQNGKNANLITNTHAHQQRYSKFSSAVFTFEGNVVRNNLNITLDDQNCEANMIGLVLADGTSHIDNHTAVDHAKPNSLSNELYKNVLGGHATAVFNGKIFVRQDAQKTLAYQSNKNILLSDTASINTKPQLEIWADDVKCSHGATSGQLDEKALFYLKARGIGEKLAKAMLVQAFAEEVVDQISLTDLKETLKTKIEHKLQNLS